MATKQGFYSRVHLVFHFPFPVSISTVSNCLVITVIVRQDVDSHFGATQRLPTGMLSTIMSANLQSNNNWSISNYSPSNNRF